MKTDRKPPLARSPMRLRNRRVLQPSNIITPLRTPSATLTKPQMKESEMRPENQAMSFELMALSKMVQDELGTMNAKNYSSSTGTSNIGPAFERGRFYDEYVARRNERLRRKLIENEVDEPKTAYNLGVKVESSMKKDFKKKTESVRKPVGSAYVDRIQHSRYSLRSTVKKPPPLPVPMDIEEKITTRRTATVSRTRRVY
ncbi:uncharacterized protein LOC141611686 [Silene latifolia]|uniref:uncharacterized protein LOC141586494 n=1 Tax=Silene latifolia TaxID=37657 RepID=UPI003D786D16